jgi:hypothetical protein
MLGCNLMHKPDLKKRKLVMARPGIRPGENICLKECKEI